MTGAHRGTSAHPRTQEVRRTEAEQRLVAAAAEMVGEVGPSRVTLANVGERAGYSRGLATHHFGSKGALMQRLVETVTHQFREAMFDQGESEDADNRIAYSRRHLLRYRHRVATGQ